MTKCFLVEPTDRCNGLALHLMESTDKCPATEFSFHSARTDLPMEGKWAIYRSEVNGHKFFNITPETKEAMQSHPLGWPIRCACGHVFGPNVARNYNFDIIYKAPDGREFSRKNSRTPGMMYHAPWLHDPDDEADKPSRDHALKLIADGTFENSYNNLAKEYWTHWSDKRPPIIVVCPTVRPDGQGYEWCVDARSSSGGGWLVTGTPPALSCSPSIKLPGYHGFLGSSGAAPGHFSAPLGDSS